MSTRCPVITKIFDDLHGTLISASAGPITAFRNEYYHKEKLWSNYERVTQKQQEHARRSLCAYSHEETVKQTIPNVTLLMDTSRGMAA